MGMLRNQNWLLRCNPPLTKRPSFADVLAELIVYMLDGLPVTQEECRDRFVESLPGLFNYRRLCEVHWVCGRCSIIVPDRPEREWERQSQMPKRRPGDRALLLGKNSEGQCPHRLCCANSSSDGSADRSLSWPKVMSALPGYRQRQSSVTLDRTAHGCAIVQCGWPG